MNKALSYKDQSVLAHRGSNYINMNLIHYKHTESQKKMFCIVIVTIIVQADLQRFRS